MNRRHLEFYLHFLISLVGLFSISLYSVAQTGYMEEVATLESLYESRARSILNTFLRPSEYTVVVSADMRADKDKIKAYREEVELQYLPGMPIGNDPSNVPANNHLHQLRSSILVHLIINSDVTPDKEKLIVEVVKSKLHMDESAGDKVTVQRADFVTDEAQKSPTLLPELSWKMWTLIILISLLALAAVIFWMSAKQKAQDGSSASLSKSQPSFESDEFQNNENDDLDDASRTEEASARLQSLFRQDKTQIVTLAGEYPYLCARAIAEFVGDGNEKDVMITFDSIGWDTSRKLFHHLSPKNWGQVGAMLTDQETELGLEERAKSVKNVTRFLLSRVLSEGLHGDQQNPFQFIFDMKPEERIQLLKDESTKNLAVMGIFSTEDQISEIFESQDPERKKQIILDIAKLSNLPENAVQISAKRLSDKMRTLKGNSEIRANGPMVAASLLRNLAPETEMTIFDEICNLDPESAEAIRRESIQFADLLAYPEEAIKTAIERVNLDVVVQALSQWPPESAQALLRMMPSKRAQSISKDLSYFSDKTSLKQIAKARRDICIELEKELQTRSLLMKDIWADIDKSVAERTRAA